MSPNSVFNFHFDLGIRSLLPEWGRLFSRQGLKEDAIAGVTVAFVAVPLSLAIALASGVPPAAGLVAAIVGGTAAALFGGTPLAVSGPAAAMAVLVLSVIQTFGLGGLLLVGFGSGLLQLLTGVVGWGRFVRFVPLPVIAGFTAGIGAIIFIGQLPRALGLPPPDVAHVLDVVVHIGDLVTEVQPAALALALCTVAIVLGLPRILPRLPAPFMGVLIPGLMAWAFQVKVETIGAIPQSLPFPSLPALPTEGLGALLGTVFIVFALASLETLLSASAVDKLAKGARHDPDQELIGQGLANMSSALFGGLPVTGVIARSALNVHAGARTRRAAIIHALVLLAAVYAFAPVMARIPVAVLSGMLLSVALRMLHPREFLELWRSSRSDALTYLVTFFVIVFVDLIAGVQAGVMAALAIAAIRFGKTRMQVDLFEPSSPCVVSIEGALTFLATSRLEAIRDCLVRLDTSRGVIIDLSGVTSIDASGGSQLMEVLAFLENRKSRFVLKGFSTGSMKALMAMDHQGLLPGRLAFSARDVMLALGEDSQTLGLDRLAYGVERFRNHLRSSYGKLFSTLALEQNPHTLFITCCDSRISPNLITSTDPGELFVIRNVGNMVPPSGAEGLQADGAGIEFAVGVLGVREIVLCGHSGCGAMKALVSDEILAHGGADRLPCLSSWLRHCDAIREQLPRHGDADRAAALNAILQLDNLKTYPLVRENLANGSLRLHAWYYDIAEGELREWNDAAGSYIVIGPRASFSQEKRMEAGVQFQVPSRP